MWSWPQRVLSAARHSRSVSASRHPAPGRRPIRPAVCFAGIGLVLRSGRCLGAGSDPLAIGVVVGTGNRKHQSAQQRDHQPHERQPHRGRLLIRSQHLFFGQVVFVPVDDRAARIRCSVTAHACSLTGDQGLGSRLDVLPPPSCGISSNGGAERKAGGAERRVNCHVRNWGQGLEKRMRKPRVA